MSAERLTCKSGLQKQQHNVGQYNGGSAMIAAATGDVHKTLLATQQHVHLGISPGLGFASSQPRCVSSTPPTCELHPAVPMKMISDIWLHGQGSSTIMTGVHIKPASVHCLRFPVHTL